MPGICGLEQKRRQVAARQILSALDSQGVFQQPLGGSLRNRRLKAELQTNSKQKSVGIESAAALQCLPE